MPIPPTQILVAEVQMKGVIAAGGSNNVNTNFIFHLQRNSTVVNPDKSALNVAFQAGWAAPVLAALNARWTQKTNDIRWVNDAQDQVVTFAQVHPGLVAGDSLSSLESAYMLVRTSLRGKSYRGSKHFGPMSEADVTSPNDDVFNAAAITRLAAISTAVMTPITDSTGNTWNLCVLSRFLSKLTKNPTTVIANNASSCLFNTRVGRMVRRQVKSVY